MIIKKTIIVVILNILFGGVGYVYIKERLLLAAFLIFVTVYHAIRNLYIIIGPVVQDNHHMIHTLPMLTLFDSIPGIILLIAMAIDIYFLIRRQASRDKLVKVPDSKLAS